MLSGCTLQILSGAKDTRRLPERGAWALSYDTSPTLNFATKDRHMSSQIQSLTPLGHAATGTDGGVDRCYVQSQASPHVVCKNAG